MAAPMVSAGVALLLQDEPNLTPDQVKYRLLATANKSWSGYSSSKSGAGYLDIYAAITGTSTQSANTGLKASSLLKRLFLPELSPGLRVCFRRSGQRLHSSQVIATDR